MLYFNDSKIMEWNKKVVYAPNSFGKTTSANSLYKKHYDMGGKVDIFSRQKIQSLVSNFGSKFFLGAKSGLEARKAEIEEWLKKNKTLVNVFSYKSKAKNTSELKENSFYCSFQNIKNLYSIPEIPEQYKVKSKLLKKFSLEDVKTLDQNLSHELFNKIDSFLKELEGYELINYKTSAEVSNYEVSENVLLEIQDIYFYCKFNKVNKCYLCGKKFKSHDALLEHIENRMSELKVDEKKESKLKQLVYEVIKLRDDSKDKILLDLFNKEYSTVKRQVALLSFYRNICLCCISYMHNEVLSSKIEDSDSISDNTIYNLILEKENIEKKLKEKKKTKKQIKTFNDYIINEMRKFLILNDRINVEPLQDTCGLSFKISGKVVDPYEILSESEIKRLSLIVLKAEVRYQHIETLILDDPIDSYDDYNKRIACQYISELVTKRSLKQWYIFTNDFECVYYLSKCLKAPTIFNLQDIDRVFNSSSNDIEVECNCKQVGVIAKNDLYFLDYFINRKQSNFEFDTDIFLCALTLTLRNVKTDFLNKYDNISISNSPFLTKNDWSNHIKTYIEGYTEHYDIINSPIVEIKDVVLPFYSLSTNHRSSFPTLNIRNNNTFETYRENVSKAVLPRNNTYSDVVNYLFKKVVIVNYLKYELEKKLMLLVKNTFTTTDFSSVESINSGLGNRIAEAIKINKTIGYGLEIKLNKIESIHKNFSSLYNSIDHGTTLMISPYLSTSVKDIENFKNEINKI